MKKLALVLLALPLIVPTPAAGQNTNNANRGAKSVTISGRVSEGGRSIIAKNGESWSVTNPDALTAHGNQQVKAKCETSADHSIRVLSVKIVATPPRHHFNPNDSAFRR